MKYNLTDSNDVIIYDYTEQEEILHEKEFRSMYPEIFYRIRKKKHLEQKGLKCIKK